MGNEIDITPSDDHREHRGRSSPITGPPNSSLDIYDESGEHKTRRWFDENGNQVRDVDFTNHDKPKHHPEVPHEHGPRKRR